MKDSTSLPPQPVRPIVVPVDEIIHTQNRPYCEDWFCPCHHDFSEEATALFRAEIEQPVTDGLLTYDEAHRLYNGMQFS